MGKSDYGQPIGDPVPVHDAPPPSDTPETGAHIRLERLSMHHSDSLYDLIGNPSHAAIWTYMPIGPYTTRAAFDTDLAKLCTHPTDRFYAVILLSTSRAVGLFTIFNLKPASRVCEIGFVVLSPAALQRTRAATEMFFLAARHVFDDCGYRRYIWKCDALNAPSRRAAARLGFVYEGTFRQDLIVKGRNRDTAWFSVLDEEWPVAKRAFERWLEDGNFDADGRQKRRLEDLRDEERRARQ